ncbi:MAG: hypothetical protein IJX57_04400 [Clostridia bacterium]|nr:hypothetical protein [Clostridia bacterium]
MRERLIELLGSFYSEDGTKHIAWFTEEEAENLADFLLLNNVIVLPYYLNLPEVMYRYMFDNNEKAVVVECKVGKNTGTGFTLVHYDGREWNYKYDDIGKSVFIKPEQVEALIQERGI